MKLFLLLVAIYSLIFYQQYKLEKANLLLPGVKRFTKAEAVYKLPVSPQEQPIHAAVLTTTYYGEPTNYKPKHQLSGSALLTSLNR
jgi:hypothetical protein